jgi:hypothetical protein
MARMKAIAWIMASVFFLTGCASGALYYNELSDGTRYYQTRTGQLVAVDKDGLMLEAPAMYGAGHRKQLQKKGDDWDLSGYDIVEPPGSCMELLSRRPESCLNRIWEPLALILMAPVLTLPSWPWLGQDPPLPSFSPGAPTNKS